MKKILISFSLVLLCACNVNTNISNSFISSFDSSSNEVSNDKSSESIISSEYVSEEVESIRKAPLYAAHPSSEPNFNNQLSVINHMGDLFDVWNYYRGSGVSVAIIDSGFDYNHPEFINSDGTSRVSEKSVYIYTDSSGNTNRVVGRNNVGITDGDSHGTMCAGLLGSGVNEVGISGIAPECELIFIKIDKKYTSMEDAFRYCGDIGVKVVSVSLGAYPSSSGASTGDVIFSPGVDLSTAFNDAIKYAYDKGVTIVSAVGNSKSTSLTYPGGCEYVIGAGGLDYNSSTLIWDNGYEGSNYNGTNKYVDVFAPSEGIYAPGFDASQNKSTYWNDGKGTSFSAPLIAGAAALYFQKYESKTNVDFENALKETCIDISSFNGNKDMGYGKIDVGALLNIKEDLEIISYNPSTTINKAVTNLHFEDEAGWNIRTLHIYDLYFEDGYGFYDFERYLDYQYGRVATSSYLLEGETKCWAYSDEFLSGDYFICLGNKDSAKAISYDYYFPWWVKGATYQFVNNYNWLPKEGFVFNSTDGRNKTINNYFWYKGDSDTGIVKVVGETCYYDYPAVDVYLNNDKIDTSSIFDYYELENAYFDNNKTKEYYRSVLRSDTYLFN